MDIFMGFQNQVLSRAMEGKPPGYVKEPLAGAEARIFPTNIAEGKKKWIDLS
jgi:hypothetical protein